VGQLKRHGGYSFIARGTLPQNFTHVRKFLTYARKRLILDQGVQEGLIPIGNILLIDRVISKLGMIRCIEESCRKNGIFISGQLAPVLRESYIAYSNSMRRDLIALDRLKPERVKEKGYLDPLELAAAVDRGEYDDEIAKADEKLAEK